jgi:hypothetical protein
MGIPTRKAFHGSPHDFDEFSLSKIGTGEGAQAYGNGLYFSSEKDSYQTRQNLVASTVSRSMTFIKNMSSNQRACR